MFKVWIVFAAVIALAGCATDRSFGTASEIEVTDLTSLPMSEDAIDFSLRPFDTLEVVVLQDPSLSGTYFINAEGNVSFPLVGDMRAAGLSIEQFTQRVRSALADGFINNPDIRIRPTEIREISVSFGGQVIRPGNYAINTVSTLLRGVNAAGGLTEFADTDDVLVMRTVNDQKYIGVYNLGAIQRGNYPDPQLVPGDIVMVGDSPARRRLQALVPLLSLLTTAVVLFDRVSN